jgi:hypothetical protein
MVLGCYPSVDLPRASDLDVVDSLVKREES